MSQTISSNQLPDESMSPQELAEKLASLQDKLDHAVPVLKKSIEDMSSVVNAVFDSSEVFSFNFDAAEYSEMEQLLGHEFASKLKNFCTTGLPFLSVFADGLNLEGKSLNGCLFKDIDMTDWNLNRIVADSCRFINCTLPSKIDSPMFSRCEFSWCKAAVGERTWNIATISESSFGGCDFSSMNFARCLFAGSRFHKCNMHYTKGAERTLFTQCDLVDTDLSDGNFRRIIISDCFLDKVSFDRCSFLFAVLSGISFNAENVSLTGTDFSYANLDNSSLSNAPIQSAVFTHASMTGARLEYMNFANQKLNCLSLAGANINFCTFEKCDMSSLTMTGANIQNSSFSNCYMEGSSFEELCAEESGFFDCQMPKSVFARAKFRNCKINGCIADYSDLHSVEVIDGSLAGCSFAFCRKTDERLYEAENFF